MISAYERSIHDDPLVRSYLAMAMGATRDTTYGPHLLNGLNDDNLESQIAAIQSIGMIGYPAAVPQLKDITITSKYHNERLAATIALGMIGDHTSIPHLTSLLEDEEPNIRWDAAVALAKMGNDSGVPIITGLLDREYLGQFKEVDEIEKKQVLMVAIKISSLLIDERFKPKLITLASVMSFGLNLSSIRRDDIFMATIKTCFFSISSTSLNWPRYSRSRRPVIIGTPESLPILARATAASHRMFGSSSSKRLVRCGIDV